MEVESNSEYVGINSDHARIERSTSRTSLSLDLKDGFDLDRRIGRYLSEAQRASGMVTIARFSKYFMQQVAATVNHEMLFVEFKRRIDTSQQFQHA